MQGGTDISNHLSCAKHLSDFIIHRLFLERGARISAGPRSIKNKGKLYYINLILILS